MQQQYSRISDTIFTLSKEIKVVFSSSTTNFDEKLQKSFVHVRGYTYYDGKSDSDVSTVKRDARYRLLIEYKSSGDYQSFVIKPFDSYMIKNYIDKYILSKINKTIRSKMYVSYNRCIEFDLDSKGGTITFDGIICNFKSPFHAYEFLLIIATFDFNTSWNNQMMAINVYNKVLPSYNLSTGGFNKSTGIKPTGNFNNINKEDEEMALDEIE